MNIATGMFNRRDPQSAHWKHCAAMHQVDVSMGYTMDLLSKHRDALSRSIAKGIQINHMDADTMMNSRAEYWQPRVARVSLQRVLPDQRVQLEGQQGQPGGGDPPRHAITSEELPGPDKEMGTTFTLSCPNILSDCNFVLHS